MVINQINDTYQTRDEKLMPYKRMVDDFKKYFAFVSFQQIPRLANRAADAMTTLASIPELQEFNSHFEFLVEELHYLAYDSPKTQIVCSIIGHDSSRYSHIYSYLCDQVILENLTHNEKRNLTRNASWYVIIANDLFRRGLDGTLLRCLETEESKCALSEVHEGICGSQSNGFTLARKLL